MKFTLHAMPCSIFLAGLVVLPLQAQDKQAIVRSLRDGPWSAGVTWEGGKTPGPGSRVLIRAGHHVRYDVKSDIAIRAINIAGLLSFAADKDTRLDVGLIKIQATEEFSEQGFDCDAHVDVSNDKDRPALQIGTPTQSIDPSHTALVRLVYFEGMNEESCPAIVCCGGRMDFHGATMNRTWVKLSSQANAGDATVTLDEAVTGWRVGDRVIVTATTRQIKAKKT